LRERGCARQQPPRTNAGRGPGIRPCVLLDAGEAASVARGAVRASNGDLTLPTSVGAQRATVADPVVATHRVQPLVAGNRNRCTRSVLRTGARHRSCRRSADTDIDAATGRDGQHGLCSRRTAAEPWPAPSQRPPTWPRTDRLLERIRRSVWKTARSAAGWTAVFARPAGTGRRRRAHRRAAACAPPPGTLTPRRQSSSCATRLEHNIPQCDDDGHSACKQSGIQPAVRRHGDTPVRRDARRVLCPSVLC